MLFLISYFKIRWRYTLDRLTSIHFYNFWCMHIRGEQLLFVDCVLVHLVWLSNISTQSFALCLFCTLAWENWFGFDARIIVTGIWFILRISFSFWLGGHGWSCNNGSFVNLKVRSWFWIGFFKCAFVSGELHLLNIRIDIANIFFFKRQNVFKFSLDTL